MLNEAQFAARLAGIGGSDAAAVCGLNPYKSPVDVWLEKMGRAEPVEENERMHWGNVLEDVVAQEYARRTGRAVRRRNQQFRHKKHDFLIGNIDRSVDGERRVLECKTADKWTMSQWGEPGSDEVPEYYLIQVAHYLAVLDYDVADLAVLIGGNDYRIYTIERDRELEAHLIERCAEFWHSYVLPDVAPPPSCTDDLKKLWPRDDGTTVVATPEIADAARQLKALKAQLKQGETEADELALRIRGFMGPANTLLVDQDGKPLATWRTNKDGRRLDVKALEAELPDVCGAYYQTTPGARPFLLK